MPGTHCESLSARHTPFVRCVLFIGRIRFPIIDLACAYDDDDELCVVCCIRDQSTPRNEIKGKRDDKRSILRKYKIFFFSL